MDSGHSRRLCGSGGPARGLCCFSGGGREQRSADGRTPVQFFFQFGHAPKFLQGAAVVGLKHFLLLDRGHVLDSDFHAVDGAENAAAHFVESLSELFDLCQSLGEEFVKARAERGIVGRDGSQHAGMIERSIQPAL